MALHTSETLHFHYMKSDPAGGGCNYGWTADFRFKLQAESSHAQNLYMVLMLFSSSRQAVPVISDMLCGHYLSLPMSERKFIYVILLQKSEKDLLLFFYWVISEHQFLVYLFEFGSVFSKLARFLYCVLWYLHLKWDIWVNYMKTLYYMADLTSWSAINLSALP